MFEYVDSGFTTFDLADHYGAAEDVMGEFRRRLIAARGSEQTASKSFQAFTKWCPRAKAYSATEVAQAVNVSRTRMQTSTLDLLQFHWWVYEDTNYRT